MGMHLSSVSRIIIRVSEAIAEKYNEYIKLPTAPDDIRKTQQDFFNIASFPRVLGAIDCTHIKIQSPGCLLLLDYEHVNRFCFIGGDDPEIFRNRKSYFSINTQTICNASFKITNLIARWPGSVHDATIFNNSRVNARFENCEFRNCLLLGDSGYPCKSFLFTPLLHSNFQAEQLYNESHIRTRNIVERVFGILKRRFPVLAYGCRLKLQTLLTIIVATSILYNIAIDMGDIEVPPTPEELDEHVLNHLIEDGQISNIQPHHNEPVGVGAALRQQFIENYFSNL